MAVAGIFALDLASTVGYAIEIDGRPPFLASKSFPRADKVKTGPQGLAYLLWLKSTLAWWRPERVVFEQPHPPMRQSSTSVATVTMGFAYVTEIVCAELTMPVSMVVASTARKFFTGNGANDKKAKGRVIVECERRGWQPPDDNAADAACILAWAIDQFHPRDDVRRAAVGNAGRLL